MYEGVSQRLAPPLMTTWRLPLPRLSSDTVQGPVRLATCFRCKLPIRNSVSLAAAVTCRIQALEKENIAVAWLVAHAPQSAQLNFSVPADSANLSSTLREPRPLFGVFSRAIIWSGARCVVACGPDQPGTRNGNSPGIGFLGTRRLRLKLKQPPSGPHFRASTARSWPWSRAAFRKPARFGNGFHFDQESLC